MIYNVITGTEKTGNVRTGLIQMIMQSNGQNADVGEMTMHISSLGEL